MKKELLRIVILTVVILFANIISFGVNPPLQIPECGKIERIDIFSPELNDTVYIDIWLPEGYNPISDSKYPVIYMHDGQNLFDASTTWNGQSWEIDRAMCDLINRGLIKKSIIVGIHSSQETRVGDLMPEKAVKGIALDKTLESVGLKSEMVRGDSFLRFLVETLIPFVEQKYNISSEQKERTVGGSSMGGLMSIYSLCEYPDVFGNAICMSTHWTGMPSVAGEFTQAMYNYIDSNLPSPATHRLYFDHGTETIDSQYGESEAKILQMIKSKGYNYSDGSLLNMVDHGAAHEEKAWASRVAIPLIFILGTN